MSGHLTRIDTWENLARQAGFKSSNLAGLCNVSPRQLQRFFADRKGVTPRNWMREIQFRCAADLISKGFTNKAVAEQLEFASATHFCREFKRHFGASPRDYFMKMSRLDNNVAFRTSIPVE